MDESTVFPSCVDGQITRAQLAKIGGNRKCPENVHLRSEQANFGPVEDRFASVVAKDGYRDERLSHLWEEVHLACLGGQC